MVGAEECITNLNMVGVAIWEAAKIANDNISNEIFLVSKENFCPVDTGALKASAKNEISKNSPTEYEHRLSYGESFTGTVKFESELTAWGTGELRMEYRDPVRYALIVHDVPNAHFNPPTASWKYLSIPLYMYQEKYRRALETAILEFA